MNICGNCLHDQDAHTERNSHFMYCGACMKLCEIQEFNHIHKPTSIEKIMEISAKKQ